MNTITPERPFIMKRLVSFSTDRPLEAFAEFRIGIRSVPYLADHGFQDMIVLPGSFYIEMALSLERELSRSVPGHVRNVTFRNPIILSPKDTVINVDAKDQGDRRVYTFYEAGSEGASPGTADRQYAATLEIDRNKPSLRGKDTDPFSIEEFQAQSRCVIDSESFYNGLRENGNQYGPHFQNVCAIWRAGDQSLGRLWLARPEGENEAHYLHPCLLDSMTQLLAPFVMDQRKTFILRSIGSIEITNLNFRDTLLGHAT